MKKKILGLLLFLFALTFGFKINAAVKDNTEVLIWTTKIKLYEAEEFKYNQATFIKQFADGVTNNYKENYGTKVKVTSQIGYNAETKEIVRNTLPDLSKYSLIFVILPNELPTDDEIKQLEDYTNKGGRLVFISENNDMAREENAILSEIAQKLGADFQIEDKSFGLTSNYNPETDITVYNQYKSERNKSSYLYSEGVEQAYAAKITYSGKAEWVYKIDEDVWVVDEAAGKGRITVISDMNFLISYYDKQEGIDTNPNEFMKLLLEDSINNINIVANGGNPNDSLGKGRLIAETNSETIKISSFDLSKIVPLTDAEKQQIDEGININVRLRVSESKEDVPVEDQNLINKTIKNEKLAMYLDVSLFKKVGDAEEEKLTILSDKMELSIDLNDNLINKDPKMKRIYKVIRTHNGKVDILPCTYDEVDNTLTFETDRFSSYALVYNDVINENNPGTGTKIFSYLSICLVSIIGLSLVLILKKKTNK